MGNKVELRSSMTRSKYLTVKVIVVVLMLLSNLATDAAPC